MKQKSPEPFLPVCSATFTGNEGRYLQECIDTGWVSSSGAFVKKFEAEFAAWIGVKHAVTSSSGTSALHMALEGLGIGPGDEVIVPSLTMIASGNSIIYAGAQPVVVDVDPVTGNIDPAAVEKAITPRTRAVMVVHLYGLPCAMEALHEICDGRGIPIVEDAAEAIGTTYGGKRAGALGKAGCFSFFANKVLTTGEGGMVVTDDEELAFKARKYKDQWFIPERRFFHPRIGHSYRMSNLQAAVGVAQLERVDELIQARLDVAGAYHELLAGVPWLELPVDSFQGGLNSHWMYAVRLTGEAAGCRDALAAHLRARNIDSRGVFFPLEAQPVFADQPACSVAADLSRRGLLLPTGPAITPTDLERVAAAIRSFVP